MCEWNPSCNNADVASTLRVDRVGHVSICLQCLRHLRSQYVPHIGTQGTITDSAQVNESHIRSLEILFPRDSSGALNFQGQFLADWPEYINIGCTIYRLSGYYEYQDEDSDNQDKTKVNKDVMEIATYSVFTKKKQHKSGNE